MFCTILKHFVCITAKIALAHFFFISIKFNKISFFLIDSSHKTLGENYRHFSTCFIYFFRPNHPLISSFANLIYFFLCRNMTAKNMYVERKKKWSQAEGKKFRFLIPFFLVQPFFHFLLHHHHYCCCCFNLVDGMEKEKNRRS